jgi:glycosyltransferase involved in cell wall biosynthesis
VARILCVCSDFVAPDPLEDTRVRVVLDCTAIPVRRAGVGRYIEGLLGGLTADQVILTLVTQRRDRPALSKIAPWATIQTVSPLLHARPIRFAWEQLSLPALAQKLRADVVHSPHYTFPAGWKGGRVVTVHDATFFSHPRTHERIKRRFFRGWTRRAWHEAHVVITPSVSTANEVTRFVGDPTAKLQVAYLGVDLARFHQPTDAEVAAFRSDRVPPSVTSWFAFLGTIEPRKNVVALLNAYRDLRKEFGSQTPELLISGGRGWDAAAIARLDSLPADSGVRELGYLPMASLPAFLGGAIAVVYPSVGEGFGLPVLEAMATGAAIITTDRLAIPEVGGDAVHYVQPEASALRDAMRRLMQDNAENARLRAAALIRASLFTWHSTATHHVTAYQLAAKENRR